MMVLCSLKTQVIDEGRRKQYRIFCINKDGTISLQDKYMYNVPMDYVIDKNLELIIGHYHMFLSLKQPVLCAGRIMIDNTKRISLLDNTSGHYMPSPIHLELAKDILLFKHGIKIKSEHE